MSVKERLKEFIKSRNMTVQRFEAICGLSNGYVSSIRKGLGIEKLEIVLTKFPELSRDWLQYGEGEMLNEAPPKSEDANVFPAVDKKDSRMIPFYDAETTGGYNGSVASSNADVTLRGYINAGDWFEGRETAAIRHTGDSMIEYPSGCILAVREVKDVHLLVPGRNYVVETDEYRVTKRVQKGSENGSIALYSSNQEKYDDGRLVHEPFEVSLQDVRRIFSVLGYIVNQAGEAHFVKI